MRTSFSDLIFVFIVLSGIVVFQLEAHAQQGELNTTPDSSLKSTLFNYQYYFSSAESFLNLGNGKEALVAADSAKVKADSLGTDSSLYSIALLRARIYGYLKKPVLVKLELENALALSQLMGDIKGQQNAIELLVAVEVESRNFESAFHFQNELFLLKDSIASNERSLLSGENEKQKKENSEVQVQIADLRLKLEREGENSKRLLYLSAGIGLIFLIGTLIFFAMKFRKVRRNFLLEKDHLEKSRQDLTEMEQEIVRHQWESEKLRSLIYHHERDYMRVGKKLNEGLGDLLVNLKTHLESLSRESVKGLSIEKYLTLQNLIVRDGGELRKITSEFVPEGLEGLGLSESLRRLCESLSEDNRRVDFQLQGRPWSAGIEAELYIFRIAQELILEAFSSNEKLAVMALLNYFPEQLILTISSAGLSLHRDFSKLNRGIIYTYELATFLKAQVEIIGINGIPGVSITFDRKER